MTERSIARAKTDRIELVRFTPDAGDGSSRDGRTFYGYGAVFNRPTRIDSWEGTFDEQFAPGAFAKTIRERTPKIQFDHGHHPMIGSVPIGVITDIHEDTTGLYVEARLGSHPNIEFIREAIESGAINGMSIRFSVIREEWTNEAGNVVSDYEVAQVLEGNHGGHGVLLRTILEAKLDEVGPVVWPAYKDTTAAVRQLEPFEELLRQHNEIANPTREDHDRLCTDALALVRSIRETTTPSIDEEIASALAEVRRTLDKHPPMTFWEDHIQSRYRSEVR